MSQERLMEVKSKILDSAPVILKNFITGLLIWLFGIMIFIPLGSGIHIFKVVEVGRAVSGLVIIALAIVFLNMVKHLAEVSESIALFSTIFFFQDGLPIEKEERYVEGFQKLIQVSIVVMLFLFFFPLFAELFRPIAVLILLITIAWVLIALYRIKEIFSDRIREATRRIKEGI